MKKPLAKKVRVIITLSVVLIALATVLFKYKNYLLYPWTRDGQVQAYIIQITSRVSGPIITLPIHDNQPVKKGDLLWKVDPRTFQAAVKNAEAELKEITEEENQAADMAARVTRLFFSDAGGVSEQKYVQFTNRLKQAKANTKAAQAKLESAKLDLEFTVMKAPTDGYITNLDLQVGSNVVANEPVLALIDYDSYWVDAFFKENVIGSIQAGDKAIVTLMSYPDQPLEGTVQSIGWGVSQEDGTTGNDLLPDINPSFDWIRLAQRIPVKIHLIHVPHDINLRVGTTASVIVITRDD